jgi:hypothetical protein
MAYIQAEKVKGFRASIKKAFPECKFSVTTRNSSTVCVVLTESPYPYSELFDIDLRLKTLARYEAGFAGTTYEQAQQRAEDLIIADREKLERGEFHKDINRYYLEDYGGKAQEIFTKIYSIVMEGNHDNSDAMTDYFDVGWYVDLEIGEWDKGYKVTK